MDPVPSDGPEEEVTAPEAPEEEESRALTSRTMRTLRASLSRMIEDIDEALRMDEEPEEEGVKAKDEPPPEEPEEDPAPLAAPQRTAPSFLSTLRSALGVSTPTPSNPPAQ